MVFELGFYADHGVADDVVAQAVTALELFAHYFLLAITLFHTDGLVQVRVKRLAVNPGIWAEGA